LATALLVTVGKSAVSGADRDRERGERGEGRGGFGDRPSTEGRANFMRNLSEEARQAMREAFMEIRKSGGQELQEKSARMRRELGGLITSGKVDEKAIRSRVMAIAEIDADVMVMRAKMFAKMKEAGVSDEMLKMMAARMGGGVRPAGGEGARGSMGSRGGFGDRGGREGFSGRGRPEREGGRPDADGKKRRPEFER
jgi:Spy/CpxP family protein refolding chaperone